MGAHVIFLTCVFHKTNSVNDMTAREENRKIQEMVSRCFKDVEFDQKDQIQKGIEKGYKTEWKYLTKRLDILGVDWKQQVGKKTVREVFFGKFLQKARNRVKKFVASAKEITEQLRSGEYQVLQRQLVSYTFQDENVYGRVQRIYEVQAENFVNSLCEGNSEFFGFTFHEYQAAKYIHNKSVKWIELFEYRSNFIKPKIEVGIEPIITESGSMLNNTGGHCRNIQDVAIIGADEPLSAFALYLAKG